MHYYQFNIGDYASHTVGMTPIEDIAYRRLIDKYFRDEKPSNGEPELVARSIGMREYIEEVSYILSRFFDRSENGDWVHGRIERDIAEYKAKQNKAVQAGKASAEARKSIHVEQTLSERSATVEQPLSQLITNNQEPDNNTPIPPKGAKPKRDKSIEIKTYIENCKAQGLQVIPEDDTVFQYAEDVGLPHDYLRLAWLEFRDRMLDSKKRYTDWRAVFRKYVRANYMKLWYVTNDGTYDITSTGKQAQNKHKRAAQ